MAFIGIKIANDVTRLFRGIELPGEKISETEQHITILCFEENWPIKDVAKAMEAAYEVLSEIEPFQVSTSKITCFPKREDNPCPIIAKIEGKDLLSLNKKLKSKFDKEKIGYKNDFKDFKPHITLSYADEEIDDIKISPIEFTVTEVLLWGGDNGDDRIFITFPLKGVSASKHSFLIQKADVFHKLSSKDQAGLLGKTSERRKIARSLPWHKNKSTIAGRGIFASKNIEEKEILGLAFEKIGNSGIPDKDYHRTELGALVNHSKTPNIKLSNKENKYFYITSKPIHADEEITINYESFPWEGKRNFK